MSNQTTLYVYDLPADVVEKLLCTQCNGYVSCGPVKLHPAGNSICGRCLPSIDHKYTRNILYEAAMSSFTFPCRYKPQGCNQCVMFDKAIEHEDVCQYRTFSCPSFPQTACHKYVTAVDIHTHFDVDHADLITKDGKFKLDLQQKVQKNLLKIVEEVSGIIQYNYDATQNILYLDVRHVSCDNQRNVYYKVQIISGSDTTCALHFKESQAYPYEMYNINKQNATILNMNNYLPALNNPEFVFINVMLSIRKEHCSNYDAEGLKRESSLLPTSHLQKHIEQDKIVQDTYFDLLEKVRCFKCNYPALQPVYEGYCIGDNINVTACGDCKQFIKRPTEKVYEGLIYPCDWRSCNFMGNKDNIVQHLQQCPFRSYYCPIEPCQKGFFTWNNVIEHMSSHGQYCANSEHIVIKLYSEETMYPDTKVYFTTADNEVSIFTCVLEKLGKWSLTGLCNGFDATIYFVHDHCRIKTVTRSYSHDFALKSDSQEIKNMFPCCFRACKCVDVVIKLQKQSKSMK